MAAEVGTRAPEFTLDGTDQTEAGRRSYSLSEYRGQPVVLVFYPGDNTPVCTRQLNSYTEDIDSFAEAGAQVLAISPQSVQSHEDFSCQQGGFAFPLLADTDRAVGEAYGILGPLGFYRRSVFVVDAEGIVRYAHRAVAGLTFRSTEDVVKAVNATS
ncbi:MAG TPA: peroxiredoxin [Acidimicrobiales bacterium]|jgi:peroxiredoxin Q/BCP|nr:peroxiredoxin [Acidimicrobiales bacterium]